MKRTFEHLMILFSSVLEDILNKDGVPFKSWRSAFGAHSDASVQAWRGSNFEFSSL